MDVTAHLPNDPAVEIRAGVFRPDWSVVTKPRAREALVGRLAARAGLLDRWAVRLEAVEDLVWRTILRLYADCGRPPMLADIVYAIGIAPDGLKDVLRILRSHDLIDLDPHTGNLRLAYPFTQAVTGHRVEIRDHVLHALCAIDALGVAGMYGTDVVISSRCHHCGAPVQVETASEGKALRSVMPSEATVWYDVAYDASAATSCCPAIVFFCSDEHRRRWLDDQMPRRNGIGLTIDEALEVGRAIFGPILVEGPSE
jgi:alkylmercury lyase-like protein